MKVPFIDLTRWEEGFLASTLAEIETALKSAHFVGGPQVPALEAELKQFCQAEYVVSCANGTDAIQIALRAAGIGRGMKVLVPEMTFWASVEAIINVGADPVCIDVSNETLHLSYAQIEKAISQHRPQALILVHLYGWAADDTLLIRKLCREQKVLLIEDSAQAFGTRLGDEDLIGSAEIATTSFYPAKVLGASGDAGAIFFKSAALAEKARSLCNHGRISHYQHGSVGWNSRIGVYEAIFLRRSLAFIRSRIEARRKCLEAYRSELNGLADLKVLGPAQNVFENGYLNVVRVDSKIRDSLRETLSKAEISSGVVYPEPMSMQPAFQEIYGKKETPANALQISRSIINLPCFPGITEKEIETTCKAVRKFFS